MRGEDRTSGALFSYVDVEARIPAQHPLRSMRRLTNAALAELDAGISALCDGIGRPSIPPERLLRATLLQLLYRSARSGNWSNGWSSTCCFAGSSGCRSTRICSTPRPSSRNRDRLLTHEIAQEFLSSLLGLPEVKRLEEGPGGGWADLYRRLGFQDKLVAPSMSAEHFSVDGTLLKAWASMKSFRPKGRLGRRSGNGPGFRRGATAKSTSARPGDRTQPTPRRRTRMRAFDPERRRTGEPSGLSWPRLDGEPQRARGGGRGDLGERNGRARGGGGFQPALALWRNPRRRQGLRR